MCWLCVVEVEWIAAFADRSDFIDAEACRVWPFDAGVDLVSAQAADEWLFGCDPAGSDAASGCSVFSARVDVAAHPS